MTSICDFDHVLATMRFSTEGKYIYYCSSEPLPAGVHPFVQIFENDETVSIIPLEEAKRTGLAGQRNVFTRITLETPATLETAGLISAIATQFSAQNIPSNVVTSVHRDHLMIPTNRCQESLDLLEQLAKQAHGWSQS